MNRLPNPEKQILAVALMIIKKYAEMDLAHDAHGIWLLAADCMRLLAIPFENHKMALALMHCMIEYYCEQYEEANLPEAV